MGLAGLSLARQAAEPVPGTAQVPATVRGLRDGSLLAPETVPTSAATGTATA